MPSISETIANNRPDLKSYEELCAYPDAQLQAPKTFPIIINSDKYFHANPELSFQEESTAASIVQHLETFKAYDIHASIGGHGVAAVLKNGPGKTLLLRADIDALPVAERSGLSYASTKTMKDLEGVEKGVMHACGHDMYVSAHFSSNRFKRD
jgi:metal-dependent amidase/aminoacylase/carboxypeptidase family protein